MSTTPKSDREEFLRDFYESTVNAPDSIVEDKIKDYATKLEGLQALKKEGSRESISHRGNITNPKAVPEEVEELALDLAIEMTKASLSRRIAIARQYLAHQRQATIKEVVERLKREEPEEYKAGYGTEGFDNANAQWRAALEKIEEEM